jgi:hypothetical protein
MSSPQPHIVGTGALTLVTPPPPTTTTTATTTTPTPTTTTKQKPAPTSGPNTGTINSSLTSTLKPSGAGASIKSILKHGTYAFSYKAPAAGKLMVDWYEGSGKKRKLIGSLTTTFKKAGKSAPKLKLTSAGRTVLKHSKKLSLTSTVTFKAKGKAAVSRTGKFTLH